MQVSQSYDPAAPIALENLPDSSNPDVLLGVFRYAAKNSQGRWKGLWLETQRGIVKVRLPKSLRVLAELELEPGKPLRIWLDPKDRATAAALIPLQAKLVISGGCKKTCVAVCSSKSCCRKGGKEIYRTLQQQPDIEVKKCGCLKSCKSGPMVKIDGKVSKFEATTVQERLSPHKFIKEKFSRS